MKLELRSYLKFSRENDLGSVGKCLLFNIWKPAFSGAIRKIVLVTSDQGLNARVDPSNFISQVIPEILIFSNNHDTDDNEAPFSKKLKDSDG